MLLSVFCYALCSKHTISIESAKYSLNFEIIHGQAGVVNAEMDSTLLVNGCHDLDIFTHIFVIYIYILALYLGSFKKHKIP